MARWAGPCVRRGLLLGFAALIAAGAAPAQDDVQVPAGPTSVRRLLGMDPYRSDATFLVDLHQILLFGTAERSSWSKVEARRKLVEFTEDLADWRQRFGEPAKFATANREDWRRCRDALDWLGVRVKGTPPQFTTELKDDPESRRRQAFLDALGMAAATFVDGLRSGQPLSVSSADVPAPLPFGIAAWRETLSESSLSAGNAFLFFVKNVSASRMLVGLSSLDPETRDGLRTLLRDEKGRSVAWRILYDDELDAFSRFPEALMIREGRFVLPGGKDAEPIWTDIFGVQPADRAGFLRALYGTDNGKGAYVVDTLQHLPDTTVHELLFGKTGGGAKPSSVSTASTARSTGRATTTSGPSATLTISRSSRPSCASPTRPASPFPSSTSTRTFRAARPSCRRSWGATAGGTSRRKTRSARCFGERRSEPRGASLAAAVPLRLEPPRGAAGAGRSRARRSPQPRSRPVLPRVRRPGRSSSGRRPGAALPVYPRPARAGRRLAGKRGGGGTLPGKRRAPVDSVSLRRADPRRGSGSLRQPPRRSRLPGRRSAGRLRGSFVRLDRAAPFRVSADGGGSSRRGLPAGGGPPRGELPRGPGGARRAHSRPRGPDAGRAGEAPGRGRGAPAGLSRAGLP